MLISEHALADHLVRYPTLVVHDGLQHVIVAGAWKQDLASVQFIQSAAN